MKKQHKPTFGLEYRRRDVTRFSDSPFCGGRQEAYSLGLESRSAGRSWFDGLCDLYLKYLKRLRRGNSCAPVTSTSYPTDSPRLLF
jgi:hypothetical protein